MQIRVQFAHASEAERLRTAVFRFVESRARLGDHIPSIRPEPAADGQAGAVVDFWSDQAAADFRDYWSRFRAETMAWSGFRDI